MIPLRLWTLFYACQLGFLSIVIVSSPLLFSRTDCLLNLNLLSYYLPHRVDPSCSQFISYSTAFSANTNTRSIASRVLSCVLPTLFILHDNCWVFHHIDAETRPLLYSTNQLAQANGAATNATKTYPLTKPTTMNHQWVFTRQGEMVDSFTHLSAWRRPREASPVFSVIVISTKLPFT